MTEPLLPAHSAHLGQMVPSVSLDAARSTLLRHGAVAALLIGLGIALTLGLPSFYTYKLSLFIVYFAATAGLTVLIGLNGQISLGHGAIMAVGGYTTAFTQNALASSTGTAASWSIFVSLTAGVAVALTIGLLIGLAAARLRGPYLAGTTLALVLAVPSITTTFDVFNGNQGIQVSVAATPAPLGPSVSGDQWRAWVAMGAVAIILVLLTNLVHSRVGRDFRAVRDHEVAAMLGGIRVARTKVVAFTVSAGTAGLAGGLLVMLNWSVQPGTFGVGLSYYLLFAIVLGGLGSLIGAAWGSLFVVIVGPYLIGLVVRSLNLPLELTQRLNANLALAVFGVTLILIPTLAPGGIQSVLRRLRTWLRGWLRDEAEQQDARDQDSSDGDTDRPVVAVESVRPSAPRRF
jgi:branched-chain amino acid transport system permease protein